MKEEQPTCMISMNDFEEGEEVIELNCKHIFHSDSIKKWLEEEDASCPICRYKCHQS